VQGMRASFWLKSHFLGDSFWIGPGVFF